MYLRAAKTEAEEAGESTDGMADSVSELRDELKALTGNRLDIMLDDTTFKSTYQILKELSEIWGDISDVSQANILELLAGKRNSNVVSALLQDFSVAEKALLESQNAAGSAMVENEKYLDSINGKLDQLKASWEQLSANVLDSELVKGAIDLIKGLIEIFNKLDEATVGASSSILAITASIIVVTSVLSAFRLKIKDSTSILGTLFGLLSSETRIASVKKMAEGIKSATNALNTLRNGAKSGADIGLLLTGITTTGGKAILVLVAIATAIYGITKAYNAYRDAHPTLDDLQEQSAQLKEEVDELSSSVETANERITELQKLTDAGTISLTEQDELNRLKVQNELLEAQLALKQALLEAKQDETQTKAQEDASEFFAESDYTGAEAARNVDAERHKAAVQSGDFGAMHGTPIELLDLYRQSIQYCDDEISRLTLSMADMSEEQAKTAQERIDELKEQRTEALKLYSETAQPLEDILSELDPSDAKDAELIKKIKNVIYQMQMLSGDTTALKSVFDDFWSDETAHEGITEYREELEKAANAQRDYNEELKQYGSNVDLTNRPHIAITDDLKAQYPEWWDGSNETYSTLISVRYDSEDFDSDAGQSIVVTPILPNGEVLSQQELEDYIYENLLQDGKFTSENDPDGIVMAVVDMGSADASKEKADKISEAAHEANAAFHDMLETEIWEDFEAVLASIGLDINTFSSSELAAMFETWAETTDDVTASLTGLTSELDTLVEKSDLLKSAQDDLSSSGTISSSTLSSIVEKFPALEESIALYIAGMKTGKELISDLSDAYQADVSAYKDSIKQKLALSPTFFENLTDNQKQLIDDLAESYQVDLGNFKTVEEAKLNFQAQIIAKLASNYSKYAGASLAELKQYQAALQNDLASGEGNSLRYQSELNRVNEAIAAIEGMQSLYDSLIGGGLEGWDPSKYSSTTSSSSSSDSYKTSVQEKINALKHQLQMEKITAEQYYNGLESIENQYYKDSAAHLQKYADEIRSIDEELFNGRRELNEDWLNDQRDFAERAGSGGDYTAQQDYYNGMFSKLQEMIKAAKDYGLDETSDYVQELYDKVDQLQSDILASVKASFEDFESYMDDFDLWKGADFSKLDWLKHELNEIIALYDRGQLSWAQYTEARNDIAKKMYDTQRDSLEEILELTMDMIKAEAEDQVEAIDNQVDAYQRLIDKKRALLQDTKDEADHEEEVAEKVKEIAELQSKIAQLSLDDSREATAKKSELETQLAEKQKELAALQKDYALDQTLDALDKTQEAFEDEKEAEKDAVEESVDSWQKLYEKAIKRIEGDWDGLYSDLLTYSKEHRDSIDGPDSLVTAWKNATSAMQDYNNSFEDAYNNISDISINPNANQSSEAQAVIAKMNANSALAKTLGTSKILDSSGNIVRDLHQENIDYADQYYKLTGQKLVYDSTAGWKYDNSTSGSVISSSTSKTSSTTQTTTANKNTSSTGKAYEATKAKFGDPPTGSTILQQGSTGAGVKWLQYYLKQAGFLDSSVAVDGQFYSRTEEALKKLQRAAGISADGKFGPATYKILPKFHTGGIVGNAGSVNDTEVLALLKKGEWVLDDTRKQNLKAMFATLKEMTGSMMSSSLLNRIQVMKPAAAVSGGDTFAPQINVSIQHNGSMTDKDAKKYGDMVANTALDQLKSAFAKRGKR